jgi:hypothetical protein
MAFCCEYFFYGAMPVICQEQKKRIFSSQRRIILMRDFLFFGVSGEVFFSQLIFTKKAIRLRHFLKNSQPL